MGVMLRTGLRHPWNECASVDGNGNGNGWQWLAMAMNDGTLVGPVSLQPRMLMRTVGVFILLSSTGLASCQAFIHAF